MSLVELSNSYSIISAREEIRECGNTCAKCRFHKAKGSKQITVPLPHERSDKTLRAFTNTAVDYAGPFITKQGQEKSRLK